MSDTENQIKTARRLLRGRFHAILSTRSAKFEGHPFGSLVPYCLDGGENLLLLLSHLSEHTRNLDADARCAFTLSEESEGDIQQSSRLTGMAIAAPLATENQPAAAERYFRYFPLARPYFEQLGFLFYRLEPLRFYYVGGFGTARWFGTDRILKPSGWTDETEEIAVVQQLNEDRAWRHRIPGALTASEEEPPVVIGVDNEGIDLRTGERLHRLQVDLPHLSPEAVKAAMA